MATTFPKIDFTKLDLSKLDLSKLDMSKLDMSKLDMPGVDSDQVIAALRDAAYITIGFGVLTVQQAQVRRRELVAFLSERLDTSKSQVETFLDALEQRFGTLETAVKTARQQVRGFLRQTV